MFSFVLKTLRRRSALSTMAMLLALLLILPGTFALTSMTQIAQSELSDIPGITAMLVKLEKETDGQPSTDPEGNLILLPGAEFFLFKRTEGESADEQIGGRYITGDSGTDEEGLIMVDGLKPGLYYFLETQPPQGHTYDLDEEGKSVTRYDFEVTGNEDKGVAPIIVYNRIVEGSLIVNKTVANADGRNLTTEQAAEEFEFTVELAGEIYETFTLKHGETKAFENIKVGTAYRVTETPRAGYTISSTGSSGNIPEGGARALFTNTYSEGSLTVTKTIVNEDGSAPDPGKRFN